MKIIDLTTLLPGPLASKILLDAGAEVVKIESDLNTDMLRILKPTKDGVGVSYKYLNDGKTVINLDLRRDSDREILLEHIKTADILLENAKPGRLSKMGLGFEDIKHLSDHLIYCSITGYGYAHPFSAKPAHDLNILAATGYIDYQMRYGTNIVPPVQIADVLTGYNVALKCLLNYYKHIYGWMDISMLSSVEHLYALMSSVEDYKKENITPAEFPLWGSYPCYGVYLTKDEKYISLAAVEPMFWRDFCIDNNLTDLQQEQFSLDNTVRMRIVEVFKSKTREDWSKVTAEYCLMPVYSYLEAKEKGLLWKTS